MTTKKISNNIIKLAHGWISARPPLPEAIICIGPQHLGERVKELFPTISDTMLYHLPLLQFDTVCEMKEWAADKPTACGGHCERLHEIAGQIFLPGVYLQMDKGPHVTIAPQKEHHDSNRRIL